MAPWLLSGATSEGPNIIWELHLKFSVNTRLWGRGFADKSELESALKIIASTGFAGVEFAQPPSALGVPSISSLTHMLGDARLELVGLMGGSLRERLAFCGSNLHPYLAVDATTGSEENSDEARQRGFRLALAASPMQTPSLIREALQRTPDLMWLPNTADLTAANENPSTAIAHFAHRVVSVHLQDWIPDWKQPVGEPSGSLVHLGTGVVDLNSVLHQLKAISYSGWLAVGSYEGCHPEVALMKCSEWLAKTGFLRATYVKSLAAETLIVEHCVQVANHHMMRWLAKHPEDLYRVHPGTFERIIAEIYNDQGYEVEVLGSWNQADGGIDIIAVRKDTSAGPVRVGIQCKRLVKQVKVRADAIWALEGRLDKFHLHKGVLATTARFENSVLIDAAQNLWKLELKDFEKLKLDLQAWGRSRGQQLWLPRGLSPLV